MPQSSQHLPVAAVPAALAGRDRLDLVPPRGVLARARRARAVVGTCLDWDEHINATSAAGRRYVHVLQPVEPGERATLADQWRAYCGYSGYDARLTARFAAAVASACSTPFVGMFVEHEFSILGQGPVAVFTPMAVIAACVSAGWSAAAIRPGRGYLRRLRNVLAQDQPPGAPEQAAIHSEDLSPATRNLLLRAYDARGEVHKIGRLEEEAAQAMDASLWQYALELRALDDVIARAARADLCDQYGRVPGIGRTIWRSSDRLLADLLDRQQRALDVAAQAEQIVRELRLLELSEGIEAARGLPTLTDIEAQVRARREAMDRLADL